MGMIKDNENSELLPKEENRIISTSTLLQVGEQYYQVKPLMTTAFSISDAMNNQDNPFTLAEGFEFDPDCAYLKGEYFYLYRGKLSDVKGFEDYKPGIYYDDNRCIYVLREPADDEEKEEYMADDKHPNGNGYLEYFAPKMESKMRKAIHESEMYAINSDPQYELDAVAENEANVLNGKHIIYLGSSVTYGSASKQLTFADYIGKRDKTTFVKEAVSGTTLVDNGEQSYIQRMVKNIDPDQHADLFVCQLSTNDASAKQPMGEISESTNLEDFDTTTVIGAIEYIICYAKQTWNCPVMFYTGTKYDSEQYGQMVEALKQLQQKYDFGIINMWEELDADIPEYDSYMSDGIHPNRKGYLEWWTPFMEEKMIEQLTNR